MYNPIAPDINKPLSSALPRQQISLEDKLAEPDEFGVSEWMKDCVDAGESIARMQIFNNLSLKENYEIIKGRFNIQHYLDSEDYFDLASAISQEFQLPKYLKHYDITTKGVDLIVGEYLNRPDLFNVVAQDEDSNNERIRVKTDLVNSYLQSEIQREITQKLLQMGLDPNKNEFKNEEEQQAYQQEIQAKYQELTPDSIERYMTYDFRTAGEHWGAAVLKNDKQRFNFREQEKEELTDTLVADRCYSHFYLTPMGYSVETWNPVEVFQHQAPAVKYAEDGDYIGRQTMMSRAQALDRYGWRMTKEQQESLYPEYDKNKVKTHGYALDQTVIYPFQAYDQYRTIQAAGQAALGFNRFNYNSPASVPIVEISDGITPNWSFAQGDLVIVTELYWRSQRKLGFLYLQNEEFGEITKIVDETFNPKLFGIKEVEKTYYDWKFNPEPNTITWCWVNQIWQGVKLNQNNFKIEEQQKKRTGIYIDVRPTSFQFKGDVNPFNPKLPVCGGIFDNRNGRSMSLVDKLKPYQIFYNAVWNQMYGILQRNNGKFFLMDVNVIPSLKDWGGEEALERFKAIADATSIGLIDTSAGTMNPNAFASGNGYNIIDLSEHDKIQALMNIAILVEQQGYAQIGITKERMGVVQASTTATGVEASQAQSFAITETYFENFNNYKRRKLNMHLAMAQYVASLGDDGDITLPYITSDLGRAWVSINKTELLLKDLGVYVENSRESSKQKQMVEQLVLNNNTSNIPLSGLVKMLRMNSLGDIEKSLQVYEAEFMQQQQAQRDHELQLQQEKLQTEAAERQKDRDKDILIAQIKAQNDIDKVTLQGIANESSFDPNADLTDKLIAQREIALKETQVNTQQALQQQQLTNQLLDSFNKSKLEKDKLSHDKNIKQSEAKSKREIENQKLGQIKEQSRNQEKLAKMKHDSDMKIANKQLEIKQLEKEMKLLDMKNTEKKSDLELQQIKKKLELEKQLAQLKANSIEQLTEVKIESAEKLAKVKFKETQQQSNFKMKEQEQQHTFKLKENQEKHKENLKNIKIKPKIKKK